MEADDTPELQEQHFLSVFRPGFERYHQPRRIVTFGPYFPVRQSLSARGELRYVREQAATGYGAPEAREIERGLKWTKWVNALNAGRKWALKRLAEGLDARLEEGIAVTVVPSHDPFQTETPLRELAKQLAADGRRIDATGCLVRHTKIRRIVWGGPSYRALHRETIRLERPERVAGRAVLLLDDITHSGASLRACEEMLYEAGAVLVQSAALGRVMS